MCENQDGYSQQKYGFGSVDTRFHITLKRDAELKKQRMTKNSIHYPDQTQQVVDDLEHNAIIERVGLNAARNEELGSEIIKPNKLPLKATLIRQLVMLDFSMR